jgi:UDP:flavonoid glycosyltransferase YjiC (YdhE family)
MKAIIVATPVIGHVNPLLAVARLLVRSGAQVLFSTASVMRDRVERLGLEFAPLSGNADRDLRDFDKAFPERRKLSGAALMRFNFFRIFFDAVPHQAAGLRVLLERFDADVLIADNYFFGTLPLLLRPDGYRPPIVHCGVSYLQFRRDDGAPFHSGLLPANGTLETQEFVKVRRKMESDFLEPAQVYLEKMLLQTGCSLGSRRFHDAMVELPDLYLQPTVPDFEYPRRALPAQVQFVGSLAPPIDPTVLPDWASELDGSKRVVLVTQGTVANADFSELVEPTLVALAQEYDLLVVVTTGNRPLGALKCPVPPNARVSEFVRFDWLLPKVDLLVTNGGYGTVNLALRYGVPMVVAGITEDKAEVSARVEWSGAGINLRTSTPSVEALRQAILAVLETQKYRDAAARLSDAYSRIDTASIVPALIADCIDQFALSSGKPGLRGA